MSLQETFNKLIEREDATFMLYAGAALVHAENAEKEAKRIGETERAERVRLARVALEDAMYPNEPLPEDLIRDVMEAEPNA